MDISLIIIIVGAIIGLWLFLYIFPINLWITALFSGVRVNLFELVLMRFRKVPPSLIVNSMIMAYKAGLQEITMARLETHYLANGNLTSVIKALVVADKANLNLTFQQATAIDLAGRDVVPVRRPLRRVWGRELFRVLVRLPIICMY